MSALRHTAAKMRFSFRREAARLVREAFSAGHDSPRAKVGTHWERQKLVTKCQHS
jgi:hypothetical protein